MALGREELCFRGWAPISYSNSDPPRSTSRSAMLGRELRSSRVWVTMVCRFREHAASLGPGLQWVPGCQAAGAGVEMP